MRMQYSVFGFGVFVFGFLALLREKVGVFFRSLMTATLLSVRVYSDVVEAEYLNCPKRSVRA